MQRCWALSVLLLMPLSVFAAAAAENGPAKPSLKEALAQLKIPPDWFETTPVNWDCQNKPWKDARLEVRRLLALDDAAVRQAVKITWLYAQKGDIGDGHELSMYLFMSGNYAWATLEYPKHLARTAEKGPTHAYLCYASCLAHFGEYDKALEVLSRAANDLPPPPWRIMNLANVQNHYGDLYAEMGQIDRAKEHYAEAMRLYPTSEQPYGRHLLHRKVAQVKTKLDLLTMQSLGTAKLRDGTYTGRALGYAEKQDMLVRVTIQSGRIADIQLTHEEKIELNATKLVPAAIISRQSLKVDAITGATVTSQAIIDGTYQALKQAGLK